ncbi:RNA recognition motif domain-containing protein [Entamoeba histolytica HM-1:IMSS-B]|uniref:RNA recognition motif domain containing protein n=5 Tax=Entamoeba histolytica TaxID=5759 RepID=C4M917_ENTH1|nr:hypothetical protein EHI_192780 [Entamoeba histolytica HM-1:IMSS]EMH72771.1 RNA recognition motif domain-containing protein [Entamoeba histolytica HM-1:IMSS-B]EMS11844.1 RNA recognition motif domain containing protein [Entamoeba histolytica HM-3:IMSS]ENY65014.1 RNA recognition motif domain containing protein [Entamoeba histolytica HM-1:IMSS-A]GAT98128.1 hypothetical protein CL6EHI_192780 [Entamoeba histolytica]EAL43816.1 hypothetical protein EHI_192780 [Entamoeba histolytica HM-1:IMSS]|eukprot:XP_649199.1 hypothetical protein EHI_192780 [Entamoeba histolytica HM-1:IMSS]
MSSIKLYVGHLPDGVTQEEMNDAFSKYGSIETIDIKSHFGFVTFTNAEDGKKIIDDKIDITIKGRHVSVEQARGDRSRENDVCYLCGKTGHWARDCKEKRYRRRNRSSSRRRRYSRRYSSRSRSRSPYSRRHSRSSSRRHRHSSSRSDSRSRSRSPYSRHSQRYSRHRHRSDSSSSFSRSSPSPKRDSSKRENRSIKNEDKSIKKDTETIIQKDSENQQK